MDTLTYSAARANLAKTMKKVCKSHVPVIITRKSEQPVVIMSLEDYNSMDETRYLLRSPKNAKRLLESIEQIKNGQGVVRALIE